jgi:hypothetical protein
VSRLKLAIDQLISPMNGNGVVACRVLLDHHITVIDKYFTISPKEF